MHTLMELHYIERKLQKFSKRHLTKPMPVNKFPCIQWRLEQPACSSSTNLPLILAELKAAKFKGRVSAEFSQRKVEKDPSLDTILADGDEIFIPLFTSDVYVTGDILNPGGRRYSSELKPSDYIEQSGGLGKFADSNRIVVIKPNGDAEVIKANYFFLTQVQLYTLVSTIYVPREIGKLEGIEFTATLAPIVSSLALSLASLNSIK